MGRSRYKIYECEYPYFLTSGVIYGLPIFANREAAKIILASLQFLQKEKDVVLFAYVIMENHVHLVAQSDTLSADIRSFKSFTARKIIDHLKENGHNIWLKKLHEQKARFKTDRRYQFWQEGYHPKQIVGDDMMVQKIDYIHDNPVKRGYVDDPSHWRYSSARNYITGQGLIPVTQFKDGAM